MDLLKQIFWRQNRYHRNNKRYHYGHNNAIESTDGPGNNSTLVRKAVKAALTSLQHGDSQIRCVKIDRPQIYDLNTEQEV